MIGVALAQAAPSKKLNFANGVLNPYGCWRRSHSSGHLGFLLTSELRFAARGELLLRNSQTFVSQTFAAQTHGQDLGGVLKWDSGQLDPGTTMVRIIHVNVNQKSENDELIEIEGLLGQQLLRSKRVKQRTKNRRKDYTLRNQKIPSFIEVHFARHTTGGSSMALHPTQRDFLPWPLYKTTHRMRNHQLFKIRSGRCVQSSTFNT